MPREKGSVKTGGRVKGTRNKRTVERMKALADMVNQMGGKLFDGDAHTFLSGIYKNTALPVELRIDAAKISIRYEKPSLSSVAMDANIHTESLAERIRQARARVWGDGCDTRSSRLS